MAFKATKAMGAKAANVPTTQGPHSTEGAGDIGGGGLPASKADAGIGGQTAEDGKGLLEEKTETARPGSIAGPGRPKGAKNKIKSPEVVKTISPRKAPDQLREKTKAIDRELERVNAIIAEHNKENRGDSRKQYRQVELKTVAEPVSAERKIPPQACSAAVGGLCSVLGLALRVNTRPGKAELEACGEAWSEVSRYMVNVDPMWAAIGTALTSTAICVAPMIIAKIKGEPDTPEKAVAA